jgi:hypothetical protein
MCLSSAPLADLLDLPFFSVHQDLADGSSITTNMRVSSAHSLRGRGQSMLPKLTLLFSCSGRRHNRLDDDEPRLLWQAERHHLWRQDGHRYR